MVHGWKFAFWVQPFLLRLLLVLVSILITEYDMSFWDRPLIFITIIQTSDDMTLPSWLETRLGWMGSIRWSRETVD